MNPTADTAMDELKSSTSEFLQEFRPLLRELIKKHNVPDHRAAVVLFHVSIITIVLDMVRDGLLAPGPGLLAEELTTVTPEGQRQWLNQNPLPVVDERSAEEILGYDENGLCGEGEVAPAAAAAYIAELEAKVKELQDHIGNIAAEHFETVSNLEEESISLEVKVEGLESTVKKLDADYRVLDHAYKKATERGERATALAEENDRLTAKVAELEELNLNLQREAGKPCESQEAIIADLEAKCKSLAKALSSGTQRCESQEKEIEELERKLQRRESSSLRVIELLGENTRLTAELQAARKPHRWFF